MAGWFLAAEKGCAIVSDLLAEYDGIPFVNPDGSFDMEPNTTRIARYFSRKFSLHPPYDGSRSVTPAPGVTIYPTNYFCTPAPGLDNYTIHLFNGAWLDKYGRKHYGSLGRLEFARFKRTHNRAGKLPLREGEKLLFTIPTRFSGRKKLAVILRSR